MGEDKYYMFSTMVILFIVIVPAIKLIAITLFWYVIEGLVMHHLQLWFILIDADSLQEKILIKVSQINNQQINTQDHSTMG